MNAIFLIALNTFKESIRNKILYNILILALGVIVLAISVADWSVFERIQVMEDFGLAAMSLTGLLMSIFIGVGLLGREISSKTVYMIISKPISRMAFLIGKFLGLLSVLVLNFAAMTLIFWIAILCLEGKAQGALAGAIFLIWLELAVLIAASILFSTFTTPTLAAMFTLAFYIGGHLNDLVSIESLYTGYEWVGHVLRTVYFIVPNLEHFNIRTAVVYGLPLPKHYLAYAGLYGALYLVFLLAAAGAIFSRKDL